MGWLWIVVPAVLMVAMVVAMSRRGAGDADHRHDPDQDNLGGTRGAGLMGPSDGGGLP